MTRFLPLTLCLSLLAEIQPQDPAKTPATPAEPQTPAQIDLLETKVRFESNGDSRKEVHCIVKINSELGVRQFARLNFDYNRSFEKIEISQVRVTHSNGGVADVLPSAISDNPNPAVVDAPAYQDVRVKSVRILGLAPSDTLEYRVITTVTKHPLAPDFWLEHTFDRTGVVSHEIFELDLPADRKPKLQISSATPAIKEDSGSGDNSRQLYHWKLTTEAPDGKGAGNAESDVMVTTFSDWPALSDRLAKLLQPSKRQPGSVTPPEITKQAKALTENARTLRQKIEAIYSFVSERVATVNLGIGSTGFAGRSPSEILSSLYASPEDKYVLFDALSRAVGNGAGGYFAGADLTGVPDGVREQLPRPSPFTHLLISVAFAADNSVFWLDPSLEVAPFNLVPAAYRGKPGFFVARENPQSDVISDSWEIVPDKLPFPASQQVLINGSITAEGILKTKVKYTMRGDNELLLRVAFHQSPREKWNEVAQLLALSDGFRGKIENVTASDPYATKDPFTVEYEISQPKFVDWSKKPVRIPAILPLVGLPDPPTKSAPIELGTPLDVTTTVTLHLPLGTTVESPAGTAVDRDYAKFSSTYAATGNTLTAARHIQFLLRELPADRALDYNTFLHAVQNDQSQRFTLFRPDSETAPAKTANPMKP